MNIDTLKAAVQCCIGHLAHFYFTGLEEDA